MRRDADDEVLGRAFDRRLAARLWAAARPHRRIIVGGIALFPIVAALELVQPWLLKIAIDEHILARDWLGLSVVAGLYLGVLAVLYGVRMVESYLMHRTGQAVTHDLREALFGHLLRLDARFFDRNPVGRLMTRVLNDVEAVQEAFTSGLFAVVADVVTLAGVIVMMVWIDWRMALVTFAISPVLIVGAAFFRMRSRDAYRTVRRRLARLNGFLQESLQGLGVVQLFARERHEFLAFQRLNTAHRQALFGSTIYEASLYAGVEALGSIALALLIWYGGGEIARGTLTFGALVAFMQYSNRFFLPIRDLGSKYTVMQAAMASSERIFALLDVVPAIEAPIAPPATTLAAAPERAPGTPERVPGTSERASSPPERLPGAVERVPSTPERVPSTLAVELRGVWFAYEDEHWVLRDCSLGVRSGEHVAIVGASGEGKTTCARLLNRSYDVARGQVLVAGVDVREWDLARLRRHVGIVFQDTWLFSGTVEANLKLGADGAVSPSELARAIERANARAFIESLPRGLAEPLGERGANVSHGQRQLLAIARALVYNPAVLVLDEATSSVDLESERLIREAMRSLLSGRTTVTIAHRLSTIQGADRILVLHRGRVHEEGTHADLVQRGGLYAKLHELQSGAVRTA